MCLCSYFSCVLELSLVADYKTPATCCAVSQSGYCCCVNVTAAGAALQHNSPLVMLSCICRVANVVM